MIYDDLDEYWEKDGVYSSDVCTIENLIFSCPYFDENYEINYSPLTKRICLSHKEKDAKFYIKDGKYSFYGGGLEVKDRLFEEREVSTLMIGIDLWYNKLKQYYDEKISKNEEQ